MSSPLPASFYAAAFQQAEKTLKPKIRKAERPTLAPPGTPEKVLILMERFRTRQRLWHRLDVDMDGKIPRRIKKREKGHDNGRDVFASVTEEASQ